MTYVKELNKILFRVSKSIPIALDDRDCLLSTDSLTFMMRQEIRSLIEPTIYARDLGDRLSAKLKRPVDLGTSMLFREVWERLEGLALDLDREISEWKDRFFFDALEADEDTCVTSAKKR